MHTLDLITRGKRIKQILLVILVLNWAVAFAKIILGLTSRCSSIAADGFHSLSDGASNIIGLLGIILASQPVDKDHPYGHKKYETFFALGIAALLFLVAFELVESSFRRFSNPIIPDVNILSFLVMLGTLIINISVMKFEFKRGKELQSDILVSDSLHTKADILISISVIITLGIIKLGAFILDPIVTVIIALFIAYAAFGIAKNSSNILCDKAVIVEEKKITDIVLTVNGVINCHKIRSRGRIDDTHIDLHVQVSPDMHINQAHEICYNIEEAIKKGIPGVTDVIVHIEPPDN